MRKFWSKTNVYKLQQARKRTHVFLPSFSIKRVQCIHYKNIMHILCIKYAFITYKTHFTFQWEVSCVEKGCVRQFTHVKLMQSTPWPMTWWVNSTLESLTSVGHYEINPPIYGRCIEKPNVYNLIVGQQMDSYIYTNFSF